MESNPSKLREPRVPCNSLIFNCRNPRLCTAENMGLSRFKFWSVRIKNINSRCKVVEKDDAFKRTTI